MAQKIIVKNPKTHLIVTPASKAYFNLKNTGGPVGPQGSKGDTGDAATIAVGTTSTLPSGSSATVSNSGTSSAAVFNFGIPKGDKGDKGDTGSAGAAATINVGTTTTGNPGTNASVTNSGTSSAAVFNFTIPRGNKGDKGDTGNTGPAGADGAAATIAAGSTTTLPAGSDATVTNSGTSSAAVFNFGIPKGDKGDKGDPGAGLVITGTVATYADLPSGLGPSDAGKAYFVQADGKLYVWTGTAWPAEGQGSQFEGPQGPAGQDGAAATVTVGTTTTLPAGSSATVTNVGTTSAAVFNFGIPKGDTGAAGTGDMQSSVYDPSDTVKDAGGIAAYVATELPTKTSELINNGADNTSTYVEADELATVATSGSYADLSNKPTIPTVNDATLTIQKNGTNVATFTANASSNATANIAVPTAVTDLSDASNYVTTSDITNVIRTTDVGTISTQNIADDAVTAAKLDITTVMAAIYPVGSIYMSATMSTVAQVQTAFGGTWVAWGAGRVPVGVDTSDSNFDTAEETGGEKTHTLTTSEMPSHTHPANEQWVGHADSGSRWLYIGNGSGAEFQTQTYENSGRTTQSAGGDGAHNNLQPYITCYMYKRTA